MPLRAFVSSTYEDLKAHRAEAIAILRRAGFFVDAMEEWTSDAREPKTFSKERVEQSDLMVLIVGHRLGYVPHGENRSVTQLEYDCARRSDIDVLTFLKEEPDHWQLDPEIDEEVRRWREQLKVSHGVSIFDENPSSIELGPALARWLQRDTRRHTPRQIPAPPAEFCGRGAVLSAAVAALRSGSSSVVTISGLGGAGKSALAFAIAEELCEQFRDGQVYFDLKGTSNNPVSADTVMQHVIRSLNPDVGEPDDAASLPGIYAGLLAEHEAIVLLDNAAGRSQVASLVPPRRSILITTSRQRFVLPGAHRIELGGLSEEDAQTLLIRLCAVDANTAPAIVRLCDDLPLALRIVADAILTRPDLAPSDFVRRLQNEQLRLAQLEIEGEESGVRASLSLSYELLSTAQQKNLRSLSVFSGRFDRAALQAVLELDEDSALEAVGALLRYSLVEWDEAGLGSGYRLHDLVRLFASEQQTPEERQRLLSRHVSHYAAALSSAVRAYRQGENGLERFDSAHRNIEAMVHAVEHVSKDVNSLKLIAESLDEAAYVLYRRLNRAERIDWLRQGVKAAELAGDVARQCRLLAAVGNCLGNEGDRDEALVTLSAAIDLATIAGLDAERCGALNLIGQVFWRSGQPEAALERFQASLEIAERTNNLPELSDLLVNISLVQHELGEEQASLSSARRALALAQQVGNRVVEGQACSILSARLIRGEDIEQALRFARQSLLLARDLGDRHQEGVALGLVGVAQRRLGAPDAAVPELESARDVMVELEDWYFAADAARQLSRTHEQLGNLENARVALKESHAYAERIGLPIAEASIRRLARLEAGEGENPGAQS